VFCALESTLSASSTITSIVQRHRHARVSYRGVWKEKRVTGSNENKKKKKKAEERQLRCEKVKFNQNILERSALFGNEFH
jgi:hypothetical protein